MILSQTSFSQGVIQNHFRSPVKPGGRNYLSGNFSELRPNHFHTGLDYKFGGVEGEPIYAAADGWIHRIKISTYGYGNVIYMKHPTGHITLYGHLRNFNPKLQKYIIQKMYEAKENDLEVYPEPGEIQIKKGERIADGGNSGSSGGPHLHFEIRDSLDRAMDPLLFGFPEIIDKTPPTPQKVALVPLDITSRINGKYQREEFSLSPITGGYRIPATVEITGRVGVEFQGFDQLDGASNRNGFPTFEIYEEDSLKYSLVVDKVDFNISRQFLLHTHNNRFTKLYFQPNLKFDYLHPQTSTAGHLELESGVKKDYQLRLKDAYGNLQRINFTLVGKDQDFTVNDGAAPSKAQVDYIGNILKIKAPITPMGGLAKYYVGTQTFEMLPAYQDANSRTYLWDMRFGVPDQIDICSEVIQTPLKAIIPAGEEKLYAEKGVQIHFEENTLLDHLFLRIEESGTVTSPRLTINDPSEYLWNSMEVLWYANPGNLNKSRAHVYQVNSRGSKSFVGGTWEDGAIRFKTRNFGTFMLAEDEKAPSITPIRVNNSEIRFTIKDDLSGIQSFEAMVNGEWVLMRYEHKKAQIWSEKLEEKAFRGPVLLRVKDSAGNVAEWKGTIS
ncbi:M23 family metallopeptidase [Algoriphagus sp. PAP.12]|uniref:M23 family metallopeptidase n=1 Tax=Algoriphagus sp. PAP.12 TaxID=2996678 RepID=UPI00227D027B|nr:M23 family metallopeptidase [Algoriphagus sp. PAP.12]